MFDHITFLYIDNPFSCRGCSDWKWIVDNRPVFEKLMHDFQCADGRSLGQLNMVNIGCEQPQDRNWFDWFRSRGFGRN